MESYERPGGELQTVLEEIGDKENTHGRLEKVGRILRELNEKLGEGTETVRQTHTSWSWRTQ